MSVRCATCVLYKAHSTGEICGTMGVLCMGECVCGWRLFDAFIFLHICYVCEAIYIVPQFKNRTCSIYISIWHTREALSKIVAVIWCWMSPQTKEMRGEKNTEKKLNQDLEKYSTQPFDSPHTFRGQSKTGKCAIKTMTKKREKRNQLNANCACYMGFGTPMCVSMSIHDTEDEVKWGTD